MERLDGRRALVTGAGTGIGRATALALAGAGASVAACGRRRQPLDETVAAIEAAGGSAWATTADLVDPAACEALAHEVLARDGGCDIVVHNAGFSSRIRSPLHTGADEWRSVMDVNTLGPMVLTRALLPSMIEAGGGDVVLVSSMAAISPNVMAGVAYSAAKSAARAYMDVLRDEVRGHGIRAITILPGEVDTPILDNRALPPGEEERATMMMPEDIADAILATVCLPRRATVLELAIGATYPRDMSADFAAARAKREA
jgi:NAD(P)-dependent dehydrogenase (short-subunit alcohol dehydrogenase family)